MRHDRRSLILGFRPARKQDRKAVLRICRNTWDGWDYIPQFFDDWVRKPGFYVAELGKRIVALGRYTELSPGEFWLEGLRVDPECRHQGIGWQISHFVLKEVLRLHPVSIRLATGRRNRHSRRIIHRMGFRLYTTFWGYEGKVPRTVADPEVFVPDPETAFSYIQGSAEYRATRQLMPHTWQFRKITHELIRELVQQGCVFGYRSEQVLEGLMILQPDRYGRHTIEISFVDGTRAAVIQFRRQLKVFAGRYSAQLVTGMARSGAMILRFRRLGLRRRRRPGKLPPILVYDYPLHGTAR